MPFDYRDEAFARLDVLAFFGARVGKMKRINDQEQGFLCPFHDDKVSSANVNTKTTLWFCHACGAKGSAIDLVMKQDNASYKDALATIGAAAGMAPPSLVKKPNGAAAPPKPAPAPAPAPEKVVPTKTLTDAMVKGWHEAALRNADLMKWLHEHRGYTDATIAKYEIGWDSQRVTIPVRDADGALVNIRRYMRGSKSSAGKMIGYAAGMNEARLYPLDALADAEIVLVEGEWDAILLRQYGINAMTVTSGAGVFNDDWAPLFTGKQVTIVYDNDDAGRKGASTVAAKLIAGKATVLIARIPGLPDKGDVTDFFVEQGRSRDELDTVLLSAIPFINAPARVEGKALAVPLGSASNAVYRDKLLDVSVLVSGKGMTPFTVPSDFSVKCDMSNKRLCGICPLMELGGVNRVQLSAHDNRVLDLINVATGAQAAALRKLAGAVDGCSRGIPEIHSSTNIEELRVIPELDTKLEGESEHVSRTAYFIGHGLRSNLGYRMIGYTHPMPKTQATVHLFREAIPAQDNISAFQMTPELASQLAIFAGPVAEQFSAIYDDLRLNVHRIQGREDMQIAYDLVWHSAIAFTFNGSYVRRGWAECMVMGDSGQGKTEMAMSLLAHYRAGQRVQGEQASQAGLIGGLEKMGDTWMLGWGKLPLNDKRLLVIDETQGLDPKQVEAMSDVRATGVAEITKIRTERTNARCRLIWLANPLKGRPISQHNQGVMTIGELFSKPEDVRRLDFAITVASGDVPLHIINQAHGNPETPKYSSDLCRSLILWAWSRRPDQIVFSPGATKAVLAAAIDMGSRYSATIPLVEPADQRLKIARLAVAAAARTFSTDPAAERILVTTEHVAFVVEYLERIYSSPSMAYDEYSGQAKSGEELDPAETTEIISQMVNWANSDDALRFLRNAITFKKSELLDVVGWDEAYTKQQIRFLSTHRLVRTTRFGYVKTPVYIGVLRAMQAGVAGVPSEDDAPF